MRALIAVGAALGAVALVAVACKPSSTPTPTTTTRPAGCATAGLAKTIAYRSIPGVAADALSVDIHAPANACGAPVVMWVHGGGYHGGDKTNQIAAKKALFNARGWILVSVNYRLTVAGDPSSAHFPDHYEDVAAAVDWVHRRIAAYGGDPTRIALLGHSAGADIVSNVADQPRYLSAEGLPPSTIDCVGPLDTEGFDKVTSVGDGESAQWSSALGNEPDYLTVTSATRFMTPTSDVPDTIGVVRGTAGRQAIERDYLAAVATTGAASTTIDARGLSHEEVNSRIGQAGDTVMTPPLVSFLTACFH